jgi:hypothetical protein
MELTLKFLTEKPTHYCKCKGELPAEYDKKTCDVCLTKEKHRNMAQRQKQKFEEIENVMPGDLLAKAAKKELHITKVSHKLSTWKMLNEKNTLKAPDIEFGSKEELLQQLQLVFEVPSGRVIFRVCTFTAIDPLANTKEITRMMGNEIWHCQA